LLTHDKPSREKSTEEYDLYEGEGRLGLKNTKRVPVCVADYKGQKPSQFFINPDEAFYGPPGKRLINAVFFVVDLFPEVRDEDGIVLKDEVLLDRYAMEAEDRLRARVAENCEYITKWTVELVISLAHSQTNLHAVHLLVNKTDLLEKLFARGYLRSSIANEKYAIQLYDPMAVIIRKACDDNGMKEHTFAVNVISASRGDGVNEVFGEILKNYIYKME
jgi:hypothetical protein